MSIFSTLGKAFGKVKTLVQKAWHLAEVAGVNDELLAFALKYIKIANKKFVDNTERREFVVQLLVNNKVKESLARLVVELAFNMWKKEVTDKVK